jgi:hypothetical protein
MSYTVINDWRFLEGADMDEAMSAIREYMAYLAGEDTGLEQSLWLRSAEEPLRYFHVATYANSAALERQKTSEGTMRFVERLYPLIDRDSVEQPAGPVVANTGDGPGEVEGSTP